MMRRCGLLLVGMAGVALVSCDTGSRGGRPAQPSGHRATTAAVSDQPPGSRASTPCFANLGGWYGCPPGTAHRPLVLIRGTVLELGRAPE